jgi:phosphonate transport system permease protein
MIKKLIPYIIYLITIVITYYAMQICGFKIDALQKGLQDSFVFIRQMFPPSWNDFKELLIPALETISLALLGTFLGSILSLFIALFAANNLTYNWIKFIVRSLISVERSIPELFILLILIAAYGLGALSAVLALMIGCIGMLGKLFADAIEETPSSVIESLKAGGANKVQIIYFGILPDLMPKLISYSLFRFEINIRLSVLLGAIGAGGIGYELDYAFSMLQFHRALSCLIVILILVIAIEQISIFIRKKLAIQQF